MADKIFQPNELNYSAHLGPVWGEEEGSIVICFCPIAYWLEYQCMPDYWFADQISDTFFPEGYQWLIGHEECVWITSDRSLEQVKEDMDKVGFVENLEMKQFLEDCMS